MRRASILTAIVAIIPLSLVGVAVTATSWWDGVFVAVGLLATLPLLLRWTPTGYPSGSGLALTLAATTWGISAAVGSSPLGVFALALAGAMVLPRMPRHRVAATLGFSIAAGMLGGFAFLTQPISWRTLGLYVLLPAAATLFVCAIMASVELYLGIVRGVEQAKQTESDLAVARERVRFAGDLHDIQGHTLHVLKLKTALARQLVDTDPAAATRELDEVQSLIAQTIAQTREIAYAQQRLTLSAELENAKRLLEAAGLTVTVARRGPVADTAHGLLAHVLRETTTNILRHASCTQVRIAIDARRLEILNDGADAGPLPPMRGLATLRTRLEESGGSLEVSRRSGWFAVSAVSGERDSHATDAPRLAESAP